MKSILATAKFWQFDENSVFPFGKHKGKSLLQIFEVEPSYLGFCLRSVAKFTLTSSGWNICLERRPDYFDQEVNSDLFITHINKDREIHRILRQNTHYDDMRNLSSDFFGQKILFLNASEPVIKTKYKRLEKKIVNKQGSTINVPQIYHHNGSQSKTIAHNEVNIIKFKIRIIDNKDLFALRKYDPDYGNYSLRIFEILNILPCGLVSLIVAMDSTNFRLETNVISGEPFIKIIPDDTGCILHAINHHFTENEIIGYRDMTQEEIDLAILEKQKQQEKLKELTEERENNIPKERTSSCLEDEEDELIFDEDEYEEEEDEYEEDESDAKSRNVDSRKVAVYGPVNKPEEILVSYSLNRQAFPNANLFRTTSLQYHTHALQFSIHADLLDELTKQWYEANNNLAEYEFKVETRRRNHFNYIRWQNEGVDEPDESDRDAWEELTDGKDGAWEDWHDPTPID